MPNFLGSRRYIKEDTPNFKTIVKRLIYIMSYISRIPGLKLDWLEEINSFSMKYSSNLLYNKRSIIFPQMGSKDTGRQFLKICLSLFLWTGTPLPFSIRQETLPVLYKIEISNQAVYKYICRIVSTCQCLTCHGYELYQD